MAERFDTGLAAPASTLVLTLVLALALALAGTPAALANERVGGRATPAADASVSPNSQDSASEEALEARMLAIAGELRCLVCQNQTIADSHADLAIDLRRQLRELIAEGRTDDDIRHYMTERYGDFVLYRPPFETRTAVLWLGPGVLLLAGIVSLGGLIARRARLDDDRFESPPSWDAAPQTCASLAGESGDSA